MRLIAATTALAAFLSCPAMAQMRLQCFEPDKLTEMLLAKHGEVKFATGDDERGNELTVWLDPADGSWTITIALNEMQCILAGGTGFKAADAPKDGDPA